MTHGPQKQILPTVFAPDHFSMMAEKQTPWPKQEDDVFYEGYTETIQNLLKKYGKHIMQLYPELNCECLKATTE